METFTSVQGVAAVFPLINVNTDVIIPRQFLKSPSRVGYGPALFHDLRFHPDGTERPGFVLNQEPYRNAKILVAGDNFGCGSAREHAAWALAQFGIRCVIAPRFADIFASNCFKNAILAVELGASELRRMVRRMERAGNWILHIDLPDQTITLPGGEAIAFEIDAYRKTQLLLGLDAIGATLSHENEISSFEFNHWAESPWLHPLAIRQAAERNGNP